MLPIDSVLSFFGRFEVWSLFTRLFLGLLCIVFIFCWFLFLGGGIANIVPRLTSTTSQMQSSFCLHRFPPIREIGNALLCIPPQYKKKLINFDYGLDVLKLWREKSRNKTRQFERQSITSWRLRSKFIDLNFGFYTKKSNENNEKNNEITKKEHCIRNQYLVRKTSKTIEKNKRINEHRNLSLFFLIFLCDGPRFFSLSFMYSYHRTEGTSRANAGWQD